MGRQAMSQNCNPLLDPCDTLDPPIRAICRGEDPKVPLCNVNLNRAKGFAGRIPPLPPLPESQPQPTGSELPSLLIKGWNFAAAIARWTLAGMPRRSQAEIEERLAIC